MMNIDFTEKIIESSSIEAQLCALRPQLLRFAMQKIHNLAVAEDLVQEALLAVLESPRRYSGLSSFSTYVIGILKYKLFDHFRYERRSLKPRDPCDNPYDYCADEEQLEQLLYAVDSDELNYGGDPEVILEQKRTMNDLERALHKLPERSARVLTLFDGWGYETDEICEELSLTRNNLMVILHRARHIVRQAIPHPCFAIA